MKVYQTSGVDVQLKWFKLLQLKAELKRSELTLVGFTPTYYLLHEAYFTSMVKRYGKYPTLVSNKTKDILSSADWVS